MKEMTFIDHLEELRTRIIRVLVILALGFGITYAGADFIAEILLSPLRENLTGNDKVVFLGLLDKVLVKFQIALWGDIILTSPLWFREVWLFIKPGLYAKEVRIIRSFLILGFFLFWAGIFFGHKIVFPLTFETLLNVGVSNIQATLSLRDYIVLALKVLIALGFIFQLPNILIILGFMEVVTKYSLKNMRRYVYSGFALLAALVTPPDVFTMMGLWLPLILLFELGILAVALIVHPYLRKKYADS